MNYVRLLLGPLLVTLVAAGCVRSDRSAEPEEKAADPQKKEEVVAKAPEGQPPEQPAVKPAPPPVAAPLVTEPPGAEPPAPKSEIPATKAPAQASKAPTEASRAPAPAAAEPAPSKEAVKIAVPATPAPTLDLVSLERRLKDTEAIGLMTKLTLRNQVDELLARVEAHHDGTSKASLAELRQPFDLLILKVLSLLQDRDAALAGAIATSREAMWGVLSDPAKFRSFLNQSRS